MLDLDHQIAHAAGAPVPQRVGFDHRSERDVPRGRLAPRAAAARHAMWEALPGQQRVALVAHELGHAAARDSRHRLVVSSALAALREWMLLCHYEVSPVTGVERHTVAPPAAGLVQLSEMVARWILAVVGLVPAAAYAVLLAVTQRQSQRAEYGADLAGAAVAGRQAMVAALSTVMEGDALLLAMRRTAMGSTDRDVLAAVRAEGQRLSAGGLAEPAQPPPQRAVRLAPAGRPAPRAGADPAGAASDGRAGRHSRGAHRRRARGGPRVGDPSRVRQLPGALIPAGLGQAD